MDIFEVFRTSADHKKASQMGAYMRNQFMFLGIPTPERKKLSRNFLKCTSQRSVDWDFAFDCWKQPEREFQYLAMDYLANVISTLAATDVSNLRELAVQKSWWDTIDGLDVIIGDIAFRFPRVSETLFAWSVDDNFWLRRIAINHQRRRKCKTDSALLERIIINNLGQQEFFINKAIGWSLREYSKTNPDWVRKFIEQHRCRLSSLSIREGSKYV
ncbi:MAG: DNA alkylation repair protein [Holosporaceae bacterium]|jgi:3-methyladenine DNA glycosylase AlkD|nr:DNA alkylation repair protein [Holosporaceae bacterium]